MKLGFIGFGEAAYCISLGLKENGFDGGICAFDSMAKDAEMGPVIRTRAQETGVALVASVSEVAKQAEIVIAAVPASYTLDACRSVADHLTPGQLYIDVSAATPAAKQKVWAEVEPTGALFVDAAMLGSLPQNKHEVPITASGSGAAAFREAVTPLGMRVTLAGDRPGDASAIKLVRSIFMKGLASLLLETAHAAVTYDVAEPVIASLGKSIDGIPLEEHMTRLLIGTAIHGGRRASEVEGSISMCNEAGIPCVMSQSTVDSHRWIAQYNLAAVYSTNRPKSWKNVIDDIIEREN